MDRTPKKNFGQDRKAKHYGPTFLGGSMLMLNLVLEFASNLPRLMSLRKFYKQHQVNHEPRIVIFSDNIDEINGIAINSRILVNHLRAKGKKIHLIGTAFHDKQGGFWEKNGTLLLSARFSMEMLGYPDNEIAIPQMKEILRYFRRYPVDLVELEVPGLGGWLILLMCKFVGVNIISHYRTDVIGYSQLLVKSRFMRWYIHSFTKAFCKLTTPVIVPSEDFRDKLKTEMDLSDMQIVRLRRGIDLEAFQPRLREDNSWEMYAPQKGAHNKRAIRFLFVGRISKEKELPLLEKIWRQFRRHKNDVELAIVGLGPYQSEMKDNLSDCDEVIFTGSLHGQELAAMYAQADYFLFPSGTDTFGNVVVESLATGTPALVSDSGGPRMIVEDKVSGRIIKWQDEKAWIKDLEWAYTTKKYHALAYHQLRINSAQRSKDFSLDAAGQAWWDFYIKLTQ